MLDTGIDCLVICVNLEAKLAHVFRILNGLKGDAVQWTR